MTTRHYRSPELYLKYKGNYSTSLDMWSIGCIIAEFFNKSVFIRAATVEEYLQHLVELLGLPPKHIQDQIQNKSSLQYMKKISATVSRKTFKEALPAAPSVAIDLIRRLLTYDPIERLDAQ